MGVYSDLLRYIENFQNFEKLQLFCTCRGGRSSLLYLGLKKDLVPLKES